MKTFPIIAFLFCFIPTNLLAQTKDKAVATQYPTNDSSVIYGGTFAAVTLYANDLEQYKYNILKRRVQKVYPYIELGKKILANIAENEEASKKNEHRKYLKATETELKAKFEEELKNLTINEGLVLVKLVNREYSNNCYAIIKEFKGSVNAFFWQQLGKRYGYDLKQEYIPKENPELEQAIEDLQTGGLVPALSKRNQE
jgi:predicted nucleic acid-binding protein